MQKWNAVKNCGHNQRTGTCVVSILPSVIKLEMVAI